MLIDHPDILAAAVDPAERREAELILSALEVARHGHARRRGSPRMRYRVVASLQLFSDSPGTPAWILYTRDADPRGLGFVTPHRLSLGHGGILELPAPDGQTVRLAATLFRCRETAPGWCEGALYFNREQAIFRPVS